MDGGAWQATPHGVSESDMTEQLTHICIVNCQVNHIPPAWVTVSLGFRAAV